MFYYNDSLQNVDKCSKCLCAYFRIWKLKRLSFNFYTIDAKKKMPLKNLDSNGRGRVERDENDMEGRRIEGSGQTDLAAVDLSLMCRLAWSGLYK